jgi:hypothetical protein
VLKRGTKAETNTERGDHEAPEKLEHTDIGLFERFMKKLIASGQPKPTIREEVAPPKRGR